MDSPFHIGHDHLTTLLANLPPHTLQAVELLQAAEPPPGQAFSEVEAERLTVITAELLDYTSRCHSLTRRLAKLPAVPLRGVTFVEFGL